MHFLSTASSVVSFFPTSRYRDFWSELSLWLLVVLLIGVSMAAPRSHAQGFQPAREQTNLDITVAAAVDVNPDEKERAAPVLVRLYELRSSTSFEAADFMSLQSGDRAVLGTDLLMREEFVLRPGEQKRIRRKSHPDLESIAVMAGYRDLAQSDWRAVEHVAPGPEAAWYRAAIPASKLKLAVQLQRQALRVTRVD